MDETDDGASPIPRIYTIAEAAKYLHVSQDYLRAKCRDRTFAAVKLANRWAMTEQQLLAVVEAASTTARRVAPEGPAGLVPGSRFRRRLNVAAE